MYTPHTQKGDNTILNHIFDNIEDNKGNYFDDLHHLLFNQDYFIIGYYRCETWIKENGLNIFELIAYCQRKEKENFGEIQNTFDNAEDLVNQYTYWRGGDLLSSLKCIGDYQGGLVVSDRLIKEIREEIK